MCSRLRCRLRDIACRPGSTSEQTSRRSPCRTPGRSQSTSRRSYSQPRCRARSSSTTTPSPSCSGRLRCPDRPLSRLASPPTLTARWEEPVPGRSRHRGHRAVVCPLNRTRRLRGEPPRERRGAARPNLDGERWGKLGRLHSEAPVAGARPDARPAARNDVPRGSAGDHGSARDRPPNSTDAVLLQRSISFGALWVR
jgi:hypothetical protein